MGQRQPRVTADEIIKVLKSLGFEDETLKNGNGINA